MKETKDLLPKLMLRCVGEEHLQTFQSNGVIWKSEENSKERISFQKIPIQIYILACLKCLFLMQTLLWEQN